MTVESCQAVQLKVRQGGLAAFADDEAGLRHLRECPDCCAVSQGATGTTTPAASAGDGLEAVRFARALRRRAGRLSPLLIAAGAFLLVSFAVTAFLVGRQYRSARMYAAEQETPEWLDDSRMDDEESSRGRRHKDEEGQLAATRNRYGIEGPEHNEDPHMAREEAREMAGNAGIVGTLKASVGSWKQPAPTIALPAPSVAPSAEAEVSDDWLVKPRKGEASPLQASGYGSGFGGLGTRGAGRAAGNEPTSGLRALMGDSVAAMQHGERHSARLHEGADLSKLAATPASDAETKNKLAERDQDSRAVDELSALLGRDGAAAVARARSDRRRAPSTQLADAGTPATPAHAPANPAAALLARYGTLDGLRFLDPNGYFANTYVPGDPELRALQARLRSYDRDALLPDALRAARLDVAARRTAQPFDPPSHAALSVYVSASERGLTARKRMLVQVGLQATPRYSGRRPAMNVGIVLDAREPLDPTQSANVRALLAAFAAARDLGDKLSLFAAGPGGGSLVAADDFRNGPLTVALERVLARREQQSVGLGDAVQRALAAVRGSDDPNAPLGSSVVIVLAPAALGPQLSELEALARQSAVDGIPLSAFGVGPAAEPDELARLALAGQGNRRMMSSGADAASMVDRELSAVSRVVARAVRLRIRLAPGVKLVEVLGSHPLDEQRAQEVRAAENSIDQRIGKNLGIERDRGQDEEGIQIVIPSFYAGDAHAVLLDVVADGPGPIADVTVRYKDLVQLGNGVARESLALPNLELARGALQRNVLENLVAHELAQQLRDASDALQPQDYERSCTIIGGALALIDSLNQVVPELRGDLELAADRALIADYDALLRQLAPPQRAFAADSLRFASLLKLQPRPEWDARTE